MAELVEVELAEENSLVSECWNLVVSHSNQILFQAGFYGYQLMELPDPNVRSLLKLLHVMIIPVLKKLEETGTVNPLNGVKVAAMTRTIRCIRDITMALEKENRRDFSTAVAVLRKEPLIH